MLLCLLMAGQHVEVVIRLDELKQAIRHGLGFALYESKMCILHGDKEEVPPAYKANAREHYMSDNEILDWIRKLRNKPVAASIY